LRDLPNVITADDFRSYAQARSKMQMRTLGFEPNVLPLDDVLFPRNRGAPNQRTMDSGAVTVFNTMSAAMGQFYQDLYAEEDRVVRQRELIRERTEKCVQECGAFPAGTRVVIFGSSANGFGSPKSDLDMCLQLPDASKLEEDDLTGSVAMGKLAEYFEESGMKSVDAARLTARIPIIMYMCPNPLGSRDGEEELLECDLSMHNPLAVLNTALLRNYAELTPVTRVLASLIKRWAKARDINNPARHTLSSYGYIVMILHFLTYHKRTGNGLVSTVSPPEGNPQHRNPQSPRPTPLLPNLQWMDPIWPTNQKGTPYRELSSLPRHIVPHPMEDKKTVNRYFHSPKTPDEKDALQSLFSGQDLSLAILLASFFRYYAYEFDYKRYVVSMHSTSSRGLVEREVKAELDGWRNYSAALTIEDPFESFYDIAHVLRGGYYHRIRREFAVAYSKIADAAAGRPGAWNKGDLREMTGEELIDWICEPVSSTEKELP
jgi:DNA polymerase sigma